MKGLIEKSLVPCTCLVDTCHCLKCNVMKEKVSIDEVICSLEKAKIFFKILAAIISNSYQVALSPVNLKAIYGNLFFRCKKMKEKSQFIILVIFRYVFAISGGKALTMDSSKSGGEGCLTCFGA